jgi:hypothetical protein
MLKKVVLKPYLFSALIINVVVAAVVLLLRGYIPPVVPLFYGLPIGAKQLVPTLLILAAPGTGILIILLNLFLSTWVKETFTKKVLIISAFFASILLAITVIKIILLVGFF